MADPITTAIATAIAGNAAQALATQAGQLLAEITTRLRRQFHGRPNDLAALEAAQRGQASPGTVASLAASLQRALAEEPAFSSELHVLWQRYQAATNVSGNVFNGTAGNVAQVNGDVHGDLNFN